MEDGDRKSLALKCLNMVQTKAEEHHAESKKLTEEYEKDRAELEKDDPALAAEERKEEDSLLAEMDTAVEAAKEPFWKKLQKRADNFGEHFRQAQERARKDEVDNKRSEIEAMAEGQEKDIKMQALLMADLKAEAAEAEAEGQALDAEISHELKELEVMQDGPKKMFKSKSTKMLQMKAGAKHKEAHVLLMQYEEDRKNIDKDEATAELEHKQEEALSMDLVAAEEKARVQVMAEEEKVVAKMGPGERKKVAEKALQLAELRAESTAAEEESVIEELSAEAELRDLAMAGTKSGKLLKMALFRSYKLRASTKHQEGGVLMALETRMEEGLREESQVEASMKEVIREKKSLIAILAAGPIKRMKQTALEMAKLKVVFDAAEEVAAAEEEEVEAQLRTIGSMEDGARKNLALKMIAVVKTRAEEHHAKSKRLQKEYELDKKQIEFDPEMAVLEMVEERALVIELESIQAQAKAPRWMQMQSRAGNFTQHFKAAQNQAREKLLKETQHQIEAMADGADKTMKLEALHMADLKCLAAEAEAEAEAEDAEIADQLREVEGMPDCPKKLLRRKALCAFQMRAEAKHKEAAMLMMEYEAERQQEQEGEDDAAKEKRAKEEASIEASIIAAEDRARQGLAAEEKKIIAGMRDGPRKDMKQKALQMAQLKAEAESAEAEAQLEEEEISLKIKELEKTAGQGKKLLKMTALMILKKKAEEKHNDSRQLMKIEKELEGRAEEQASAARNDVVVEKSKDFSSLQDGPLKWAKQKALQMAILHAEATAAEQEAEEEDAQVEEERNQVANMKDGARKDLALECIRLVQAKAAHHHQDATAKRAEYAKEEAALQKQEPGLLAEEKEQEAALVEEIESAAEAAKPPEWANIEYRSTCFSENFKTAKDRARELLVEQKRAQIEAMENGPEKEAMRQALKMAELKAQGAEAEAEAAHVEAEITAKLQKIEQMPEGFRKTLKQKALQVIQIKAQAKHTEAQELLRQYGQSRQSIENDPQLCELEHDAEVELTASIKQAEEIARVKAEEEEAATIDAMLEGPAKESRLAALSVAKTTAAANAAEEAAQLEDVEFDAKKAEIDALPTGLKKAVKMKQLLLAGNQASAKHKEAAALRALEAAQKEPALLEDDGTDPITALLKQAATIFQLMCRLEGDDEKLRQSSLVRAHGGDFKLWEKIDVAKEGLVTMEQWSTYLRETCEKKKQKKGEAWLSRLTHTLSVNLHVIAATRAKQEVTPGYHHSP